MNKVKSLSGSGSLSDFDTNVKALATAAFLHSPREVWGARVRKAGLWHPHLHFPHLTEGSG